MKKTALIAMCSCLLVAGTLNAQDNKPTNEVTRQANFRQALWFGTDNASALAFAPLYRYNELNLSYEGQFGKFSPAQKPTGSNDISLNTSGSFKLGGFWLWGSFSFNNIFDRGSRFNATRYEVPENNPYYLADTFSSRWNRQEYELKAKMASPVLWSLMSFGLGVDYSTKVGAKQLDPRAESYKFHVSLTPSFTFEIADKHHIGVDGFFCYDYERSQPSLNNGYSEPKVFISRGLGEYLLGKVGGNDGQKLWFYKAYEYGAGLQYSYRDAVHLLVNASYHKRTEDAKSNPKLPQRMGAVEEDRIFGDIQLLFGESESNKFTLAGSYSDTDGFEFVQRLNTSALEQEWEVVSKNAMSKFRSVGASLSYDHLFGNSDPRGYDWRVAARAEFSDRDYSYFIPASSFSATSALVGVEGNGQFKFSSSSLLVGVNVAYNASLAGEYVYGGSKGDSELQNLYLWDIDYYTADFLKAGVSVCYTLNRKKVNYKFELAADYYSPFKLDTDKTVGSFTFGIIF